VLYRRMILHTRHLVFRLNDVLHRHPSAALPVIEVSDCTVFARIQVSNGETRDQTSLKCTLRS
jgi:hypothetical protein